MQHISLRSNQLNDEEIKLIALGIGETLRHNSNIIQLNLSLNRIGDLGAIELARVIISLVCLVV